MSNIFNHPSIIHQSLNHVSHFTNQSCLIIYQLCQPLCFTIQSTINPSFNHISHFINHIHPHIFDHVNHIRHPSTFIYIPTSPIMATIHPSYNHTNLVPHLVPSPHPTNKLCLPFADHLIMCVPFSQPPILQLLSFLSLPFTSGIHPLLNYLDFTDPSLI